MFTVSKGNTSKLLVKTRRGIPQKLDNLENNQHKDHSNRREANHLPEMSSPKPIFHPSNGRRSYHQKNHQEPVAPFPQQEEMIKYIHETWKTVLRDYETSNKITDNTSSSISSNGISNSNKPVPKIAYYKDRSSAAQLPKFEPFDLETYWGERLFQNITQSTASSHS